MHRRKRRKPSSQGDVELNLAAMMDMAFQLLTFFILTFRPSPVEGQISLRLPPAEPVSNVQGQRAGSDVENKNPLQGLNTLTISVLGTPDGRIQSMAVDGNSVGNLEVLKSRLRAAFGPESAFEQVIIQVGSDLRYEELMRVVDVCTEQKLPTGEKLSKLSFVELKAAPSH
jgi:biopolymer transport protein ExbD